MKHNTSLKELRLDNCGVIDDNLHVLVTSGILNNSSLEVSICVHSGFRLQRDADSCGVRAVNTLIQCETPRDEW